MGFVTHLAASVHPVGRQAWCSPSRRRHGCGTVELVRGLMIVTSFGTSRGLTNLVHDSVHHIAHGHICHSVRVGTTDRVQPGAWYWGGRKMSAAFAEVRDNPLAVGVDTRAEDGGLEAR